MLENYGSIGRITSVSDESLSIALAGFPHAVGAICAAKRLVRVGLEEQLLGTKVTSNDKDLVTFLIHELQNLDEERLLVVYLDAKGIYQRGERLSCGGRARLALHCRSIVQRALDLGSGAIILAHNHISNDCRPSSSDIAATDQLRYVANAMEIELLDHIIVGSGRAFSIKEGQYL